MIPARAFPYVVKVCGVRRTAEVEWCARAGATHVGFNLWPQSPRRISPGEARSLVAAARRAGLVPVLLFLPGSPLRVQDLAAMAPAVVQWYGPLPPALAGRLRREGLSLWETRRADGAPALPRPGSVVLLDGPGPEAGGTGRPWRWERPKGPRVPFVLAGGLGPENVARAVEAASPSGVDAASGLEGSPGRKDPGRILAFCDAAREALLRYGGTPLFPGRRER